jgi:uncharacterized protein YceK
MNKKLLTLTLLISLILISGCSTITKQQAEQKAVDFVNEKVKFYAKEKNTTVDLPQYHVDGITSYRYDKSWMVIVHISSDINGTKKENDLALKIDESSGKVIEFNGVKVK